MPVLVTFVGNKFSDGHNRVVLIRGYIGVSLGGLVLLKLACKPSKLDISSWYLFYEHQISTGKKADSPST